jgi:ribonuclease D
VFEQPAWIVETDADLERLAERLSRATVLGVDTEADSMYHYQEKVCLVQFTDDLGDIIVDPLRAKRLEILRPIFADPKVVKIFHGADYDIVSLKRDFGLEPRNLFDTLVAAQFLGYQGLGLADLIRRWFGIELDKKHQRHDWSQRPLLQDHLDYARGDTHWLPALREILLRQLGRADRLRHTREECALLERRDWPRKAFDPEGWVRIKGANGLDDAGKRVLRRLYLYRDEQARELDRPVYKVIGDQQLLDIAARRPMSGRALEQLMPTMRGLRRRHEDALLDCVQDGLDDPPPPERPEREPGDADPAERMQVRLGGRAAERLFEELKTWRNRTANRKDRGTSFAVANNTILKRISVARPIDLDELATVPEIRRWQVEDFGEELLDVLERYAPVAELPAHARAPRATPQGRRGRRGGQRRRD